MPSEPFSQDDAAAALCDIARLQWQCRRGMLELDYLLKNFLEQHYDALPDQQKSDFLRLLDYPDQILRDWFMGRSVPREAPMQHLVKRIRGNE
jgi:antitoxin CptB